jgi:hypothetical protein
MRSGVHCSHRSVESGDGEGKLGWFTDRIAVPKIELGMGDEGTEQLEMTLSGNHHEQGVPTLGIVGNGRARRDLIEFIDISTSREEETDYLGVWPLLKCDRME